jgi:DNA polymerase-3 subunit epsilon
MLSIDCEMTGLDPKKHAIISIGGVDISDPTRQFYGECYVFDGAEIDKEALCINGFSEEECLDKTKDSETELMQKLYEWVSGASNYTLVGQNVYTDKDFLNQAFKRSGIDFMFNHRIIDTHSVAYADYLRTGKEVPIKESNPKVSSLNLDQILKHVGIPEEPRPHNALTGAKVSAEAFSRIVLKKKLLPDFEAYDMV